MDQINNSILKLMNFSNNAFVNGNKADFGANREPTFDVLLEQKNHQANTEVVTDKSRRPDASEKETTVREEVQKKEPSAGETEEENCDVAREAAAAQIVWMLAPNAQELRVPEQQENVATIEQPMIIATNDEQGALQGEEALAQLVEQIPEVAKEVGEEIAAKAEELAGETTEVVAETVQTQSEPEVGGQIAEDVSREIVTTDRDADENGMEATAPDVPLFEDVEAAPIKVAEAPARAENTHEVENQVTAKLTEVLETGETKVELQLDPVELGKVTIELTRDADGAMSVVLNAENAQTRGLLERHMGSLQESLAERSQQSVQVTVQRGEESQRQDNLNRQNDFQDGSNGHRNEQQRHDNRRTGEDFLQQLRLGLIPLEDEDEEDK